MGKKTKIDWCDSSWNPVTGCEHGCSYCYARGIAERFGTNWLPDENPDTYKYVLDGTGTHAIIELDGGGMQARRRKDGKIVPAPYPLGFAPTLHRYKLDEPQRWTKPRNIFVCSMADLFGAWVPLEWIREVFDACRKASQHRYIFLTKNPRRLQELEKAGELPDEPNFWYGSTVETYPDSPAENCWNALFIPDYHHGICKAHTFVSIEPIMGDFEKQGITNNVEWVIVGAETGSRKGKIVPERRWIENLAKLCDIAETPLFMKESLLPIMGTDFRQEFPWEV